MSWLKTGEDQLSCGEKSSHPGSFVCTSQRLRGQWKCKPKEGGRHADRLLLDWQGPANDVRAECRAASTALIPTIPPQIASL
jgi:hypothetical protein